MGTSGAAGAAAPASPLPLPAPGGVVPPSLPLGDLDLVKGVNSFSTVGLTLLLSTLSSSLSLYLSTDLDLVNGVAGVCMGLIGWSPKLSRSTG